MVKDVVNVTTEFREDWQEDFVKLLSRRWAVDVIQWLVGQHFIDVDAVSDRQDRVPVEALKAVGQGGQGLASDGCVTDAAQEVTLKFF